MASGRDRTFLSGPRVLDFVNRAVSSELGTEMLSGFRSLDGKVTQF